MSDPCGPAPAPPEETSGVPVLVPPAVGGTTLVEYARKPRPKPTANRETDAVTALKRGLKEYLEQVSLDVHGVRVRFEQVHDVWADTDQIAVYPSAAIMATDEADYDYSSFTPTIDTSLQVALGSEPADTKTYLVKYAEVTVRLACEIHCSTAAERVAVAMMLEDALNPVDWMNGFMLDLPHYYNQRVVFEPMTTQMLDSNENARHRWRPGTVFLSGQISLLRARSLPQFRPATVVVVVDGA